jgi:hypothetical protein
MAGKSGKRTQNTVAGNRNEPNEARRDSNDNGSSSTAATAAAADGEPEPIAEPEPEPEPGEPEPLGAIDPAAATAGAKPAKPIKRKLTAAEKRKRGRDRWAKRQEAKRASSSDGSSSSGAAKVQNKTAANLAGLESVLLSLHAIGSAVIGVPELRIDQQEAKALATAAAEVMKHYPVMLTEKQLAITNLVTVMTSVYGIRAMAYRNRKRAERAAKLQIPMPPAPATYAGQQQAAAAKQTVSTTATAAGASGAIPNGYSHTSVPPIE